MHILVYMPSSHGGIADYAHDQSNALHDLGVDLECLCTPDYANGRQARYRLRPELDEPFPAHPSSLRSLRRLRLGYRILGNTRRLAEIIGRDRRQHILTHFSEYLAPLWAPRLRQLGAGGASFATVLHDPVRDYVVGPRLWHEWSVRQAFSFVKHVFVHSKQDRPDWDAARQVVVPYGIHPFPAPDRSRVVVRQMLALPANAKVLLAAGFIRDNKNLDLVLRAMVNVPEVYLIVAGSDQDGGNRPAGYYRSLAEKLGCADRCRWLVRYIDPLERANLFGASDLCVLTYSGSFHSASSTLSGAANYRLPCIASSGSGALQETVERYRLGTWVEPDSVAVIEAGLRRWLASGASPDWERYLAENSWTENARRVAAAMFPQKSGGDGRPGVRGLHP